MSSVSLIPNRVFIYTKDVMNITGRSESTARRMLVSIRKKNRKEGKAFVTVEDFCAFTGLKEDKVTPFLI